MKPELEKLARHRLSRAREAFAEGEQLLSAGGLMGAVNRLYYPAFYAARALLALREVDSSRRSRVISLFQRHFVKTQLVNIDKAKALPRAFEKRQKSDYGDFSTVTVREASAIREEVKTFLEECNQVLERIIAEKND
ncbi:MAG TPA: HEPN domain-containing protein [Candidatus Acidoferrales bacterium]|nr:HEPN domain-containing protein [Candidatus Acidoferrales bacterium]